jgi:hypothetical protein
MSLVLEESDMNTINAVVKNHSYILDCDDTVIAKTDKYEKSGTRVMYSRYVCEEAIDANREYNLVNSSIGRISNSKKSAEQAMEDWDLPLAEEINEREYVLNFRD